MNLVKYLVHMPRWKRLPMIPRTWSVEYDRREVDRWTQQVMAVKRTRSPHDVEVLMKKHGVKNSRELALALQPRRRRRHVGRRVIALIQRIAGTTSYDPFRKIAREHMRRDR
jgi:hypothetical protein